MSEEQKKKKKAPIEDKASEEKEIKEKKKQPKEEKPEKETKKEEKVKKEDYDTLNDKYLRTLAEYDNFRRRSGEEKDSIYSNAYKDAIIEILPVIDSLEKAAQIASEEGGKIAEGISMVLAQWKSTCAKLDIEEIETSPGTQFDPEIHNAVMHIDDDSFGKNEITETFQKGYRHKDHVIRFAMVKVAN